jgi:DNA-binding NtrC family response regulator
MSRILLVEDEPILRRELGRFLSKEEHDVEEAGSVAEALAKGSLDRFDLVITDLRLPGAPGTELIKKGSEPPVMVITAYSSTKNREEAINRGAASYMPKPVKHDELHLVVERLLAQGLLRHWTAAQAKTVGEVSSLGKMIGDCPAMLELKERIDKYARTDERILIHGETGTGKELVAQAIHDASQRHNKPFVKINCGAMPVGLLESELFGCDKGGHNTAVVTRPGLLEAADGGTLFLDEIGELHISIQPVLLTVIEDGKFRRIGGTKERKVDVRVIAATNRDLTQRMKEGAFRPDLYHRFPFRVGLPPLRERGDDVEKIAQHLLRQAARRFGRSHLELTPEAIDLLRAYPWPGNVRELDNRIKNAAISLSVDEVRITAELLEIEEPKGLPAQAQAWSKKSRDEWYREVILANQASMSETKLAELLGLTREGLWKVRQRLGISR